MHIHRTGVADDLVDDGTVDHLDPPGPAARPEEELGGVLGPGEVDERGGHVRTGDLRVAAPELAEQPSLPHEALGRRVRKRIERTDVHADDLAVDPRRHPRRAAQEVLAARGPGQGDDHPFLGLPRLGDAVPLAVVGQLDVDAVGDPQQRELP